MANTLNIPERTLNQLGDSTNSINVIGTANGRKSAYEPLVVRATNHIDNDAAEVGSDTDKMAIFMSSRHGEPWLKQANVLSTVIHEAAATPSVPTNVSCLYPNYDYTTFS